MSKELKNNVIEQNGNKLTVNKICASKNKVKVCFTIESNKSFKHFGMHGGLEVNVFMGDLENRHTRSSAHLTQDNKIEYEVEINNENGFAETGVIRVDVVDGYRNLNASLKIPVNFKEDFQDNYTQDLSGAIKGTDIEIKQFVSNRVETGVVLLWPDNEKFIENIDNSNFLINVDGKIYLANNIDDFEADNNRNMIATAEDLTYDQIKDSNSISVMNYYNSMTDEELNKYYEDFDTKDNILGEVPKTENGETDFLIKFNDKTEGKIKVIKENDNIKIYCSSDSDKKSMLMAMNTFGLYCDENNDAYDSIDNKVIYKDKKVDNQYIIELNNVEKDKTAVLLMEKTILEDDKFVFGNEIKVK
ncbi:hypothetical protein [Clostridium sp. SM-530-WT-3G]|uniref:hypothetical protein n=1 Tax=Clostridium sp. SM-530-WT-3G TaxID=2725303 RepID=UPI00145F33AE|nr:hypothetical protein [Clostridium sp. SM-530-WT-3G]NME83836.1 hypothetical protein [Clostridium sp. SM-530-WT-3G]